MCVRVRGGRKARASRLYTTCKMAGPLQGFFFFTKMTKKVQNKTKQKATKDRENGSSVLGSVLSVPRGAARHVWLRPRWGKSTSHLASLLPALLPLPSCIDFNASVPLTPYHRLGFQYITNNETPLTAKAAAQAEDQKAIPLVSLPLLYSGHTQTSRKRTSPTPCIPCQVTVSNVSSEQ